MRRRSNTLVSIILFGVLTIWLMSYIVSFAWDYRTPTPMLYEADIVQYANATWPQRRIPRWIHQTYRTHEVPTIWNATVQSVIEKNHGDFKYRRWSHDEMDAFVKENEPEFYRNTYITYSYDMQRIDSFRYVLMYYIGGVYIDMDNGCNRPFRELLTTLEALDPDVPHIATFPKRIPFGVESDFIISTAGHPFHKQLISRLHWFNHYYIFHFWTMLVSAGPIYVSIQERFFRFSEHATIRLLDIPVFRPMFTNKQNGLTWARDDIRLLFFLNGHITSMMWCVKISVVSLIFYVLLKKYRIKWRRN